MLLATALAMSLAVAVPGQPANATAHACEPEPDSYNCLIIEEYPHGWRNVTSLTYCFPRGTRTYRYSNGPANEAFELPVNYRKYVDAAAHTWTTRPGLRVSLTATECGPKTDIFVRGFHGKRHSPSLSGEAGCFQNADRSSKNFGFCQPRSGRLLLSVDIPDDDKNAGQLERAAVHEFGHVFGLDHPCDNMCVGPIMSYASCKTTDECTIYPNYDDVAGMQIIYRMSASGGCRLGDVEPSSQGAGGVGVRIGDKELDLGSVESLADGALGGFEPDYGVITRTFLDPEVPVAGDVVSGATAMIERLADPRVNAAATLETTAGVLSNEIDWLLMEGDLDDVVPNPTRCLGE